MISPRRCTPPTWKRPRRSAAARASGHRRLNPRKVETRRVPIVFDPRVAGSLVGHLASAINGASIARKTSFLKDRMGERLFRSGIRIIDDPHRRRGLRSHPFDGEGVGGKPLAVIEDGVLKSWFLDSATARELSLTTTGHASRGVSSSPSPSPTNLHLEAGARSPKQLIADIADGFYVTDLIGMGDESRHRRLQPRRLGAVDRERRAHLPGERSHHRGTSQGDLRVARARGRSRIPLRHQRADRPDGRIDRCGPLSRSRAPRSRTSLRGSCARQARSRRARSADSSSTGPRMAARR